MFAIVIAGIGLATQWATAHLAYQPQLGAPWAVLGGTPIYHPWSLFAWWYRFDAYALEVFGRAGMIAAARRPDRATQSELRFRLDDRGA